jgi:2'-5' RNA ligase
MFAIVSLLDQAADQRIRAIHSELETKCGLKGIRLFPYPHFTWIGGNSCQLDKTEAMVGKLASITQPISVTTTGLGLFTGTSPVIYVPLVKTDELIHIHQQIWDETHTCADELHPFYQSASWVPHITLALIDITVDNLICAMSLLSFQSFEMTIQVNNLALVYQEEGNVGELGKVFPLKI